MKTTIKTLAFALLSLVSVANANATDGNKPTEVKKNFAVNAYRLQNKMQVNLYVEKYTESSLRVTVKNDKGDVLFSEYAPKNVSKYGWKLDMSTLEDGTYKIMVTDGKISETKEITLESQQNVNRIVTVQ
jgi:hypothetical protein